MTSELRRQLREWAADYHTTDFIKSDPVQFPHRYSEVCDVEISGLLTAVLSFGNRRQIIKKVDELDGIMHHAPLTYLLSEEWRDDFRADDVRSFYRMISYADFHKYLDKLYQVYVSGNRLEDVLLRFPGIPMERICTFWGVSSTSPQKKLNMFLRWMVRRDSTVDFGIWTRMNPADLIIPLDTHVCRIAYQLGLIDKPVFSLATARKITAQLNEVFPDDPCLGDFALFGYGVTHP